MRTILTAIALSGTLAAGANVWTGIGPEGGYILRLAADPQNPSTVYAATKGGVFKTADAGASWTAANSGLPVVLARLGFLAVDPQNSGTVYTGTSNNIFKTTDGGASWSLISSVWFDVETFAIARSGVLYASGNVSTGILKSTDGGATWTQMTFDFGTTLAVDPQNPDTIYANGPGGLSKSTDGGASWNPAHSGLPAISVVAVDPQNSATLYAAGSQIFKSTDGGAIWRMASVGLPPAAPPAITSTYRVLSLAINPLNPTLIYALVNRYTDAAGVGPKSEFFLATSTNAGASWTTATDPILGAADLVTIMADPKDEGTLYLSTSSGVLKTIDGGVHWNFANPGLRAAAVGQVVIDSQTAGTLFAVAPRDGCCWHGTGLFKSTDGGNSWFPSGFGLPSGIAGLVADSQNPRTLYIQGPQFFGSGVFKSEDAGGSWAEIWSIPTPGASLGPLAVSAQAPRIMYSGVSICSQGCVGRVAKSVDAGRTWTQPQVALKEYVSAIAADPRNPDVVYAGTADRGGWYIGGLSKSVDGGSSWRNLIDEAIYGLFIDQRSPDTIYTSGGGWARSTDGGETWTGLRVPCDAYFGVLMIDPQNSSILYCGDNAKVLRSADAGASWTEVGSGLRGRVNSLTCDPQDSRTLYAGTTGGLFAIKLTTESAEPQASSAKASPR